MSSASTARRLGRFSIEGTRAVAPNPCIEGTCSGTLRLPPQAPHVNVRAARLVSQQMGASQPTTIPIRLLLIPSVLGLVAWGLMAATTHGGLGLPSAIVPLLFVVVLGAILVELCVVPIGIRRLSTLPPPRTGRNVLVVVLTSVILTFQLLLLAL